MSLSTSHKRESVCRVHIRLDSLIVRDVLFMIWRSRRRYVIMTQWCRDRQLRRRLESSRKEGRQEPSSREEEQYLSRPYSYARRARRTNAGLHNTTTRRRILLVERERKRDRDEHACTVITAHMLSITSRTSRLYFLRSIEY